MRILWVIALVAFLPVAFFATRSSEALNPAIQNQFDLAIDTNGSDNTDSSLGDLDPCVSVNQGDLFEVDLVVRNVGAPGIAALAGNIIYDPAVLRITAVQSAGLMLDGAYFSFGDTAPDGDGDFRIDSANLQSPANTGDGAILRLTFEALAPGGSTLTWDDFFEDNQPNGTSFDGIPDVYYVDLSDPGNPDYIGVFPNMRARGAEVLVGSPCPGNLLDGDGDGWSDVLEDQIETLVVQACAETAVPNDELYDAWPLDMDDNRLLDLGDILKYNLPWGAIGPEDPATLYTQRLDLNADNVLDLGDILKYNLAWGSSCVP